jgi:predicted acylesterase/phospholipase RssA
MSTEVAAPTKEASVATRPLRVLALDGGGIRGVIPATLLAEIERRTGRRIAEMFDLIAGTSTGGILALGLTKPDPGDKTKTKPHFTAEDLIGMYEEKGHVIFGLSLGRRLITLFGLFGSKYAVRGLDETLDGYFGESRLNEAVAEVLITSYDLETRDSWFLARHKALQDKAADFPMVRVARATSAAPTYFRPERLSDDQPTAMIDGGVHSNNPAMCAWVETVKLYGQQDIVVVSLGTGEVKTPISFSKARKWGLVGWVRPLIGIFMDGVAATVEHELSWLLEPKGNEPRYFRFQAELPSGMGSMDNTSAEHIAGLKEQAQRIIDDHKQDFDDLCVLLSDTRPAPPVKKQSGPPSPVLRSGG